MAISHNGKWRQQNQSDVNVQRQTTSSEKTRQLTDETAGSNCTRQHGVSAFEISWRMDQFEAVLRSLKKNKTRDPTGIINEIFKPGVIGSDLKVALLSLLNGCKTNQTVPPYMMMANTHTIYKNKGSRFDLKNDRGIFILSVLRKILDKLIYNDKYSEIASNMSDSNIGAQKDKNIKNHL